MAVRRGRDGPIDERDIAAVAVRALSEASLAGGDYVLTGPAAPSHARQVGLIGEELGRRLAFHELSPDDFRRETTDSWPPIRPADLEALVATCRRQIHVARTAATI